MPSGIYKHILHSGNFKKGIYQGFGFQKRHKINLGRKLSDNIIQKISKALIGRKYSEESKRKMSEAKNGEKHWNWKGGISFEPYSLDWTETLRRAMRERDRYICQLCNSYGNVVHHKNYDKTNCNPDNLITLCQSCNSKVNFNRKYWTNNFKE